MADDVTWQASSKAAVPVITVTPVAAGVGAPVAGNVAMMTSSASMSVTSSMSTHSSSCASSGSELKRTGSVRRAGAARLQVPGAAAVLGKVSAVDASWARGVWFVR